MSKITKQVRYKDMSLEFIKEVKGLKMYFTHDATYCVIVDKEDNVLFELRAECAQNSGFLEDAT